MHSTKIRPKVDVMFDELKQRVSAILMESFTTNEAIINVTKLVSSELATRSKFILSDMLFDLSDNLMETDFFADIARQNKFYEINLRQEILGKYQFAPDTTVNYKENSRVLQALKVGGATIVVGGVAEISATLIAGLSISSLAPISIGALVAVSLGAALADYYVIEPKRNKTALAKALDQYLIGAKQQFLDWFDEVEKYFNMRVEEIKQMM